MTTTLPAHGGGAQPARIDTSGKVTGGAAMRVYGFASEAEALAAGFVCEGGPAMSVAIITDAQIASGAWKLDGDPFAVVIYTAPDSLPTEGGFAVPVYPVNGWGSAPAPSGPQFSGAEIGTVNASTVAVTFDRDVQADENDFLSGVTIKVNGSSVTLISGIRQTNHAIVYYALTPAVISTDAVTWEYSSTAGIIVSESDNTPLADVSAQSVANNVPDPIGDALRADAVAYWTMNEASGTRADSTGHGNSASPTNAPSAVAGKVGNAVHFDVDLSQILTAAHSATISMANGNWYIACWVKILSQPDFVTHFGYTLFGKIDTDSFVYEYELHYATATGPATGKLTFYNYPANMVIDSSEIQIGEWVFVEMYFDVALQTGGIAVNGGAFVTAVNSGDPVAANAAPLYFGNDPASEGFFADADIDEVLFSKPASVPISNESRAYLYNSGAGRTLYP